jgi:hypothetical protein
MPTYNDGGVPYGVSPITISGTVYVAEEMRLDVAGDEIVRRNGVNVVTGRVIIDPNNITGTYRLQRATTGTAFPAIGATFTFPGDVALTGQGIVMSGGQNYGMADAHLFEIAFARRINY